MDRIRRFMMCIIRDGVLRFVMIDLFLFGVCVGFFGLFVLVGGGGVERSE